MARISRWTPAEVVREARSETARRMKLATVLVRDVVKKSINRGNPTGEFPSAPGEPPKKVTARLFQSITEEVIETPDLVIGRVGTNVEYARRLELGFVGTDRLGRHYDQKPRPFLRPGLAKSLRAVRRVLGSR